MAFLDDLNKATDMFVDGTKTLALNAGINNAQRQIADINTSQQDEIAKRAATEAVAKNLALDMTKSGQSASAIQTAFGAINPTPINNSNDASMQGLLKNSPELGAAATKQQTFEEQPKLEQIKAKGALDIKEALVKHQADAAKADRDLNKQDLGRIERNVKAFNGDTKQAMSRLEAANRADQLLDEKNPSGVAQAMARTGMARLSGEVGNLSEWEQAAISGNPGIVNTVKRMLNKQVNGEQFTSSDVTDLKGVIQIMNGSAKQFIQNTAKLRSQQLGSQLNKEMDEEQLMQKFLPKGLLDNFGARPPADAAATPNVAPAAPLQTVRLKDGRTVKGRYLPNGQFQVEQ